MRLRRAEMLGDWYVLDTDGTDCRGQPEGTHDQWTAILENAELGDASVSFKRVGYHLGPHDTIDFYSPRNSHGPSDFVPVPRSEIPAMRAFLKAEGLGGVEFESVDQKQIEDEKP